MREQRLNILYKGKMNISFKEDAHAFVKLELQKNFTPTEVKKFKIKKFRLNRDKYNYIVELRPDEIVQTLKSEFEKDNQFQYFSIEIDDYDLKELQNQNRLNFALGLQFKQTLF